MIDYIDPTLGFGLAILLWGVYAWQCKRMTWHGKYRTLDCRDGRHLACETCDCLCHIELRVMPDD